LSNEYNINVVMDGYTLNKLGIRDEDSSFLLYWLGSVRQTKAAVPRKTWNEFIKTKTAIHKEHEEFLESLIAFFKSIATPYRSTYGTEAGIAIPMDDKSDEKDEPTTLEKIVRRHYATIEHLIVDNPDPYRRIALPVKPENITSIAGFYKLQKVQQPALCEDFNKAYLTEALVF
jgi:hypothetical protein